MRVETRDGEWEVRDIWRWVWCCCGGEGVGGEVKRSWSVDSGGEENSEVREGMGGVDEGEGLSA